MQLITDYRSMDIYPSQSEILGKRDFLRKNVTRGEFRDVHDYLDIHFKLLREDFVSSLREEIQNYRSNRSSKSPNIHERTMMFRDRPNDDSFKIKIPQQKEDSKKFMNGSLLVFTMDNFASIFLAKVLRRDVDRSEATIEFVYGKSVNIRLPNYFLMIESTYFDPYFQVLSVLQRMSMEDFPMKKYIVNVDTSMHIPRYLLNTSQGYVIDNRLVHPQMLMNFQSQSRTLNGSQFVAFRAALAQEFVVIQGPPGTGKTFLGVKIVETLIKNHHFWYRNTPILVLSQKNFALDHFLEGLIPITSRLIRVGGQSKSKKLEQFNLANERYIDDISTRFSNITLNRTPGARCKPSPKDYLSIMRQALIVGMTTSLASRWKSSLEELKCPIVIVEEAAEVLEAHVVAALTPHCQHLILLGDHQQLQPITSDHDIGKKFDLGISLFERMIMNRIPCYRLEVQHRMRPEISSLLRANIYPFLVDDESVRGKPPVLGVDKDVFFVDHRCPEESCDGTSKRNGHEATFMAALANHLVLNGHQVGDVVILAAYGGQVEEIKRHTQAYREVKGVRVMTVDAFQGREAEVVLLSLVRSESVGFLAMQNRICVALSRAKRGFYIIGNMELLSKKSGTWNAIKKCLKQQASIGEVLTLRCQLHPETVTRVRSGDDFRSVRNGGCQRRCEWVLKCKHRCLRSCHTDVKEHKCEQRCKPRDPNVNQTPRRDSSSFRYSQPYEHREWRNERNFMRITGQTNRSFIDTILSNCCII